ncbi:hypothetical protein [Clostridium ganghwense]|uniref:DUF4350 domain-containing protein n=1 Tax=Clostridium ganghwense TaxID=312089 RepID=A0ABT4CRB1_9CLOT|nr:hypothetical protein [Clostridium ganghwense]MCY6371603.1 hypothetical protein [Clostridium ganghwense]
MKIRLKGFLVIFLTLFIILATFPITSYASEGKVDLNVKVGFNGSYKVGYYVPINVDINNKLKDIDGEIQVETESGNGKVTIFAKPINLPINSTKQVYISVPIMKITSKLNIKLVQGKKVVYEEEKTISTGYNSESFFTGILSDEFDNLNYISSIGSMSFLNSVTMQNKTLKLNEKIFPQDYNTIRMFDVIVINDFDTSKLSNKQYDVLKKWVNKGGTLIIGTGSAYNKTFSIFKDEFLSGKVGETTKKNTDGLYSLLQNNKNRTSMDLNILDIKLQNGTSILKDKGVEIVKKIQNGKGSIVVAGFDFGVDPMPSWNYNSQFVKNLIQKVLPSDYYSGGNFNNMQSNEGRKHDFRRALNIIPELPVPSESKLIIIFIIYIILIAPVNYLILKKKDKREYMWITVPVISLVFVVIMYVSGISTKITGSIANVINIIEVNKSGNLNIQTYSSIFTPNKGDMKIESADGMDIEPIFNLIHDNYPQSKEKIIESKIIWEPKTSVEFYNNSVFENKILKLNVNETKKGILEGKLNYINGEYNGEIKNNLGFDLEDCYLITSSGCIKIGEIKKGEVKKINQATKIYSNNVRNNNIYDLVDNIYNDYNLPRSQHEQIKLNNQKRRLLLGYFKDNDRDKTIEPTIFGWTKVPITKNLLVNGKKIDKYEKSLVTAPIELSYRNGNIIEIPFDVIRPKVEVLNGIRDLDSTSQWIDASGEYEINFNFDKKVKVEDIKLKYKLETRSNNNKDKEVIQYIWNNKTAKWEEGIYQNLHIKKEDTSKYVDNNNKLKLKLVVKKHASVEIPKVSVKGSVK